MPLIQRPAEAAKKASAKLALEEEVFNEILAYCQWANVTTDHFMEQASLLVFKKDKSWRAWKKQKLDLQTSDS